MNIVCSFPTYYCFLKLFHTVSNALNGVNFLLFWHWLCQPSGGCSTLASLKTLLLFAYKFGVFRFLGCKVFKTDASIRQAFSSSTPSFCEKCSQNTSVASENQNWKNANSLKNSYENCGNLLWQQLFIRIGVWNLAIWIEFVLGMLSKGNGWQSGC